MCTPGGMRLGLGPSIFLHSGMAEVKVCFFWRLTWNGKAKLPKGMRITERIGQGFAHCLGCEFHNNFPPTQGGSRLTWFDRSSLVGTHKGSIFQEQLAL